MSFAFEDLNVYNRALKLVERIDTLCEESKGKVGYPVLDQITRAVLSVPLNIAEGNGRWHKNDKKRFLWIARGSVFEVVPILRVMKNKGCVADAAYLELYNELEVISKMLNNLIKAIDSPQEYRPS